MCHIIYCEQLLRCNFYIPDLQNDYCHDTCICVYTGKMPFDYGITQMLFVVKSLCAIYAALFAYHPCPCICGTFQLLVGFDLLQIYIILDDIWEETWTVGQRRYIAQSNSTANGSVLCHDHKVFACDSCLTLKTGLSIQYTVEGCRWSILYKFHHCCALITVHCDPTINEVKCAKLRIRRYL